jgi:uncharacterized protein (TIGR03084 family)
VTGAGADAGGVFDDLEAEEERLDGILAGLSQDQWLAPSAAAGWSVADVILHLAQSEEGVVSSAAGTPMAGFGGAAGAGQTVDDWAAHMVRSQRAAPGAVFERWRRARRDALAALRAADPDVPLRWVAAPIKPETLATTRMAEHWAHALDVTGPFGMDLPDTDRLRHIAWLAHRTLPYALARAGQAAPGGFAVRVELTAPDGLAAWRLGRGDAESVITGPAGAFCRVAAQRLDPASSGLRASGPHGALALSVVRTYA